MSIAIAIARLKSAVPPRADGVYESGKRGITTLALEGPMLRIESEREGRPQPTVLVPISNVASLTLPGAGAPVAAPASEPEPEATEPEAPSEQAAPVAPAPKAKKKS